MTTDRRLRRWLVAAMLAPAAALGAVDIDALWDFGRPAVSEQRFNEALAGADAEDRLVLQTQIARTHGLRRDVARAAEVLAAIGPEVQRAGPRVQAHWYLERGRTQASATGSADREAARRDYLKAHEIATAARLDALAVDALHMLAFVDTAPADRLHWSRRALAVAEASDQPAAKRWEASLRGNAGVALQDLGRHAEALAEFRLALAARERAGSVRGARIAQWMVAKSLRLQGRLDEALALQQQLEAAWQVVGEPDPYVFEELELLYRAKGYESRASAYAARLKALPK